jgi:predicted metal-dependent RNase
LNHRIKEKLRGLSQGMRITNLNPGRDIGASAWMVELEGNRLLMDAGVHPKIEGRGGLPNFKSPSRIAITTTSARCRSRCVTFRARTCS